MHNIPESHLAGLWDTHCHLHLYKNRNQLRKRMRRLGMGSLIMTTTPEEYQDVLKWVDEDELLQPCLGLFPLEVTNERTERFFHLLPSTRFVGEVGLDYTVSSSLARDTQRKIFHRILIESAQIGNMVLSIHSRRASRDVIDMIGRSYPGTIILHWFSGSSSEASRVNESTYFSLNTAMIVSDRGKELIKSLNPERLLIESDGPFVLLDEDQPATPLNATSVIHYLSQSWREDPQVVAALLAKNTHRALGAM